MIKTIIKRSGKREPFSSTKLNGWSEWAAKKLNKYVDWSEVVLHAVSSLPEECTSKQLQDTLISYCLSKNSWEYNLMAGRLYAALLIREIHDSKDYPTVKQVHDKLIEADIMVQLPYSDEEYAQIEKIIDHSLNLTYPHYALHQNRVKYSLQNKKDNIEYETSQFIYMRMAMAAAQHEDKSIRMKEVARFYKQFSKHKVNVPTPYYVNMGTKLNGYASCCLFTTKDTAKSLAAADHIAYMMTVMSAGIGYHLRSRSIKDKVRGGSIEHQGKYYYIKSYAAALGANLQNGRGGAGTCYYNAFDPEVDMICKLKNPITPLTRQLRGSDYSFGSNRLVVNKAAKNEEMALFSLYDAPELYEAIYSGDQDEFERLYEEFLLSDKPRKMVSARKVVVNALKESLETGRHYEHFTDNLNIHTPFYDTIYSSNLCVTGDSVIDYCDIDGNEYSVTVKQFSEMFENAQQQYFVKSYDSRYNKVAYYQVKDSGISSKTNVLYEIHDSNGNSFKCTPEHLVYISGKGYIEANKVNVDDLLLTTNSDGEIVESKVYKVKIDTVDDIAVYDVSVYTSECFFCNNILIHNCAEIALPTSGFNSTEELYQNYNEDLNFVKVRGTDSEEYTMYSYMKFFTVPVGTSEKISRIAKLIKVGDTITLDNGKDVKIEKVIERSTSPEVALCNIGGIIVSNIANDDEYREAATVILKLIRFGIHNSDYVFKHIADTAKKRMNAGVGIVGLAHHMAKNNMKYSTQEGKNFIHELAETHYWHLANAALQIGKDYGNAPWMYKTKWPDGWLPIDTYNKNVDKLVTVGNKRDWDSLRLEIIANGGIAFSTLVAHMPSESCLKKDTKISTVDKGNISLADIFAYTGLNLEEEAMAIDITSGGRWFDLPEPIMVNTTSGPKPCTSVWLNGYSSFMTIGLSNGKTYDMTHHHKLKVIKNDGEHWIKAIELVVGDKILFENGNTFEVISTNVDDRKDIMIDINVEEAHEYILECGLISHNSSISGATTNGLYPIRDYYLNKTNETMSVNYVVPDSTKLRDKYEIAWNMEVNDLMDMYIINQKWTDQTISADFYYRIIGDKKIKLSDILKSFIRRHKYGLKTRYYHNSQTGKGVSLGEDPEALKDFMVNDVELPDDDGPCEGCSI